MNPYHGCGCDDDDKIKENIALLFTLVNNLSTIVNEIDEERVEYVKSSIKKIKYIRQNNVTGIFEYTLNGIDWHEITSSIEVDSELSITSEKPVQNKIITTVIIGLQNLLNELSDDVDEIDGRTTTLEGKIETIESKPAYNIIDTNISNWNNEIGAKSLINTETSRAIDRENEIDNKLNYNVEIKRTGSDFSYNGDTVTFYRSYRNLKTNTTDSKSENIALANDEIAGMMSPSDYQQIRNNTSRIEALEGQTIRLLYSNKTNPTAQEISAFVTSLGYTENLERIGVVIIETYHIWHYYTGIGWKDDGTDTVTQFTNTSAGIIKGSTNDGQIFAETNGTGSVNGWSTLKNRVAELEDNFKDYYGGNGINIVDEEISINTDVVAIKNEAVVLDNIITNKSVGALPSGTSLKDKSTTEILKAILVEYAAPIVNFSGYNTLYLKGTTQNITLNITVTTGDSTLNRVVIYNGETIIHTQTSSLSQFTYSFTLSDSATIKVRAYDSKEKYGEKAASIRFVGYTFNGAVDTNTPTSSDVSTLTSSLLGTKSSEKTFTFTNRHACYAYPKSFGELTSIKDTNNFEYISSFNRTEITINNLIYYCYTQFEPATVTSFVYKFN